MWSTDDIKPKLVQQWMKIVFYENMSKCQWEYENVVPMEYKITHSRQFHAELSSRLN